MDEAFGVKGPGGLKGPLTLFQHAVGSMMMDIIWGEHRDPGMAVLGVVPGEERPAEGDGGGDVFEAPREAGVILQGLELRFGERVVIADLGAAQRAGDLPYTLTLGRDQHSSLHNLAVQDPGAVYYVFPFYVSTHKLVRDGPNLARDTWLLPAAPLDGPTVFAGQKTKRVQCYPGTAVVNPDYPMKNLAELALSWIRPAARCKSKLRSTRLAGG